MDAYGNPRMQFLASHFLRPHMIEIDHEDHIWLVDDMANTVSTSTKVYKQFHKFIIFGSRDYLRHHL